jgi:hypothetical protein
LTGSVTLARQFAQGDDKVARGAFQAVGASFQSVSIRVCAFGDRRQRVLDLTRQAASLCFRLLLSARHLKFGRLWLHIHKWKGLCAKTPVRSRAAPYGTRTRMS